MKAKQLMMSSLQAFIYAMVPISRAFQQQMKATKVLFTMGSSSLIRPNRRHYVKRSTIKMMPEGPEVRTLVDQLQGGVGLRLTDIQFLSGRYVKNGRPNGFEGFARTMSPSFQPHQPVPKSIDIIQEWKAKGKFIYLTLDNGSNPPTDDGNDDFQRSIWVTLGMTGRFVSESIHEEDPRHARWYLELLDVDSGTLRKIFFHDQRNFGTLKFSLSREELDKKLQSLGPDILDSDTTEETFFSLIAEQKKPDINICIFLMDQSKVAGVGNYILSECLYRADIDPFASLDELDGDMRRRLFREIQAVARESYQAQGLTRQNGGTFRNLEGDKGNFEFQLQCYGRDQCIKGNRVIRETNGPHKRTIWYTNQQLFMPLAQRKAAISRRSNLAEESSPSQSKATSMRGKSSVFGHKSNVFDDGGDNKKPATNSRGRNLVSGLEDEGWKKSLSEAIESESFRRLDSFLEKEQASGATIYPPEKDIFSALNLCPLDKVKVVIVGQDPYHAPGQGHGLAFSVRHGVRAPPSLKNIVREAMSDVGIAEPMHGNLEYWAQQGVLLLNTVLTVRRGEANSHSRKGWEDFTDAIIRVLNEEREGLVFLLWGLPAAKKAQGVDDTKHVIIQTSHPSPLGATKTASPFLGSRCFSRANRALEDTGKTPIDWNVL